MKSTSKGVLFLDFDGVICSDRAYLAAQQDKEKHVLRTLDPVSINLVDRLCQDFDLEVVISSTWRTRYPCPEILLTHGFRSSFHKDEKTPVSFGRTRGMEISDWLEEHPEVTRYLIVDDCTDGLQDNFLTPHHVQTDQFDGFLTSHYYIAKKIMEKQNDL